MPKKFATENGILLSGSHMAEFVRERLQLSAGSSVGASELRQVYEWRSSCS